MSPLRRLFVLAFWGAVIVAYIAAIVPNRDAPHLGGSDKLDHMAAFLTMTVLARLAYPYFSALKLIAAMALLGAAIELSQAIPLIGRDAEVMDWVADMVAALAGLIVAWPLAFLAERRRSRRKPR